jgi:cyanophycinase-like exopeptidase
VRTLTAHHPNAGPIALVGSGEFLPVMEDVDRRLLKGRPPRVVFLPTAAAPEGRARVDYWVELALEHYRRMGVGAEPLLVLERSDADRPEFADRVAGAGLIYFSGGNPAYLTDTLRDSKVWRAIHGAWENGAALAGCSAGAIALTAVVRDRFAADAPVRPALGVVPHLAVLPHFDRLRRFRPELAEARTRGTPDGVTLVGVDEDTAIVGGPVRWTVMGRQRAWVLREGAEPLTYDAGSELELGV